MALTPDTQLEKLANVMGPIAEPRRSPHFMLEAVAKAQEQLNRCVDEDWKRKEKRAAREREERYTLSQRKRVTNMEGILGSDKSFSRRVSLLRESMGHFPHSTPTSPTTQAVSDFLVDLKTEDEEAFHNQRFKRVSEYIRNAPAPQWLGIYEKDVSKGSTLEFGRLHAVVREKHGLDENRYPGGVWLFVRAHNGKHAEFFYQYSLDDQVTIANRQNALSPLHGNRFNAVLQQVATNMQDERRKTRSMLDTALSYGHRIQQLANRAQEAEGYLAAASILEPQLQATQSRHRAAVANAHDFDNNRYHTGTPRTRGTRRTRAREEEEEEDDTIPQRIFYHPPKPEHQPSQQRQLVITDANRHPDDDDNANVTRSFLDVD